MLASINNTNTAAADIQTRFVDKGAISVRGAVRENREEDDDVQLIKPIWDESLK